MTQPWIYMYSPSQSPLPPPSLPNPSGSSQCTRPEHLSHGSNLGWWSVRETEQVLRRGMTCRLFPWIYLGTGGTSGQGEPPKPRNLPQLINVHPACTSGMLNPATEIHPAWEMVSLQIYAIWSLVQPQVYTETPPGQSPWPFQTSAHLGVSFSTISCFAEKRGESIKTISSITCHSANLPASAPLLLTGHFWRVSPAPEHSSLPAAASSTSSCRACFLGPLAQEVRSPRSTPGHSPTGKSQSPFPGEPDLREGVSQAQEMCNWYPISSSISFPPLSPLNLQSPPLLSIYTSSNPSHIKTWKLNFAYIYRLSLPMTPYILPSGQASQKSDLSSCPSSHTPSTQGAGIASTLRCTPPSHHQQALLSLSFT